MKNSGVNGAVKWMSQDRVMLAMNNRGIYADKFWFSLFHEIKHVLQQKIKTIFVSSTVEEMIDINNSLELDADKFATNYLIPPADYKRDVYKRQTLESIYKILLSITKYHF